MILFNSFINPGMFGDLEILRSQYKLGMPVTDKKKQRKSYLCAAFYKKQFEISRQE